MTSSLLYINTFQFGYHIDSYMHCKYLRNDFKVTYICFDNGYPKIKEDCVEVIYVPWNSSYFKNGVRFMRTCINHYKTNKTEYLFAVYFPLVSLLNIILGDRNMILDFRTGSVDGSKVKRRIINSLMRFESFFFKRISVISESLALKLKLNMEKVFILPLGADILSTKNKTFDSLRLFYIGTLDGRNIQDTVYGLKLFLESKNTAELNVTYDIVGNGNTEFITLLQKAIENTGLQKEVILHGKKLHKELKYYFDNCNVGVSYIPITEYYDCQPPTKTFEYVNAGMACIATETQENKKLITFNNGFLCQDNPESFCRALTEFSKDLKKWDSSIIRNTLSHYNWANISENLKNYILNQHQQKCNIEKSATINPTKIQQD